MSVAISDWPKNHRCIDEFNALVQVHKLGLDYDHLDAVDASIDAVRDLLHQGNDLYSPGVFTSCVIDLPTVRQVLMDFVVYGEQGDHYTELVDANIDPFDACSDSVRALLKPPIEEEELTRRHLLRITNELLRTFIQKGKDEPAVPTKPDLMARCRHHAHGAKDQPCYLEK